MTKVFMDSIGLLAIWNTSDQWHSVADAMYKQLRHDRVRFMTTSAVFLEVANAASRRSFKTLVAPMRLRMKTADLLIDPTEAEIEQAWKYYDSSKIGDASVVDLISFAVMRRIGITRAFTNDRHFAAAGFQTLF